MLFKKKPEIELKFCKKIPKYIFKMTKLREKKIISVKLI